jgi:hypothetical protein
VETEEEYLQSENEANQNGKNETLKKIEKRKARNGAAYAIRSSPRRSFGDSFITYNVIKIEKNTKINFK